jgi:hypothetical protein
VVVESDLLLQLLFVPDVGSLLEGLFPILLLQGFLFRCTEFVVTVDSFFFLVQICVLLLLLRR